MAKLLIRLNYVPDDEAEDIREILNREAIEFYETDSGRFGFSIAGIWLVHAHQYAQAQSLLDEYQAQRASNARADYNDRKARGEVLTWKRVLVERPIVSIIALAFCSALIYFSLSPFFQS